MSNDTTVSTAATATATNSPTMPRLPDPPSNFSVDAVLSNALLKLSFDDRLEIEEERHGVGVTVDETPEMVRDSLLEFDRELNDRKEQAAAAAENAAAGNNNTTARLLRNVRRVSREELDAVLSKADEEKTAARASSSHPYCYLNDPAVRLRFLRCERFRIHEAVSRMVLFLEYSQELFGDFVADRPFDLGDFTREEELALMQSRNQFLPFRDRSGRRVLVGVGNCNFHLDVKLRYKVFLYLFWAVGQEVETQKRGIVILCWAFDEDPEHSSWETILKPQKMPLSMRRFHKKQYDCLPVRVGSLQHFYRDTPFFRMLAALYLFNAADSKLIRSIYKVHFGEPTELLYKMAGYGIPTDLVPVSCTGTLKFANHQAWLGVMRTSGGHHRNGKLNNANNDLVACPGFHDVIFRKGGNATKNNPGNTYYRELVEATGPQHAAATKKQKQELTAALARSVYDRGGRFLDWEAKHQAWVVVRDDTTVRNKIASALKQFNRTAAKRKKQHEKEQQQQQQSKRTGNNNSSKKQLDTTIQNAMDIGGDSEPFSAAATNHHSPQAPTAAPLQPHHPLKEYYSRQMHPSKRLRLSECGLFCTGGTDESGGGNGGGEPHNNNNTACFGQLFFPTHGGAAGLQREHSLAR